MSAERVKKKQRPASSPELAMYKFQDAKSHGPSFVVIFTETEKKEDLCGNLFRGGHLDGVDFSRADLCLARFEDLTLTACNFARADLRGASFVRCDLRWSTFDRVRLGKTRFDLALFAGCTGLTAKQRHYIERHGGTFAFDLPRGRA